MDAGRMLIIIMLAVFVAGAPCRAEEHQTEHAEAALGKNESSSCLNSQDGQRLVDLARRTIKTYLETGTCLEVPVDETVSFWMENKGCFVTLTRQGALRGCIGTIVPRERLCDCVTANAINAAVHDQRFPPVTLDELESLDIEISVLTVPQYSQTRVAPGDVPAASMGTFFRQRDVFVFPLSKGGNAA